MARVLFEAGERRGEEVVTRGGLIENWPTSPVSVVFLSMLWIEEGFRESSAFSSPFGMPA